MKMRNWIFYLHNSTMRQASMFLKTFFLEQNYENLYGISILEM